MTEQEQRLRYCQWLEQSIRQLAMNTPAEFAEIPGKLGTFATTLMGIACRELCGSVSGGDRAIIPLMEPIIINTLRKLEQDTKEVWRKNQGRPIVVMDIDWAGDGPEPSPESLDANPVDRRMMRLMHVLSDDVQRSQRENSEVDPRQHCQEASIVARNLWLGLALSVFCGGQEHPEVFRQRMIEEAEAMENRFRSMWSERQ